jgi:hypothetical protein
MKIAVKWGTFRMHRKDSFVLNEVMVSIPNRPVLVFQPPADT